MARLRASATLESPAGRHALRLAMVVLVAELVSRHLPLERGYWIVMSAAATLRPEYGATFTRGTERALGTCLGVGVAGAIALALHPAGGVTFVLVALLAWAGFALLPASFAVGFGFITAVVVFLLSAVSPDTLLTAWARLLDTSVGGAIGLLAYVLWPTWSVVPAWQALSDLLDAQRAYLRAILGHLIDGGRGDENETEVLSRRARLAWSTAEDTVARSLAEPVTRRINGDESQGALAAMGRLLQVAHMLRLDLEKNLTRPPLAGLAPLAGGLDDLLSVVAATLRTRPDGRQSASALADVQGRYSALERVAADHVAAAGLSAELEELVEAAGSLVAAVGLDT